MCTLGKNTTGSCNTAFGSHALFNNTTGAHNTSVGHLALNKNTTGAKNTASGVYALGCSCGSNNTSSGYKALGNALTGDGNVAVGMSSGLSTNGGHCNVFVGQCAGGTNTTGDCNITIGHCAMGSAVGGVNQIVIGHSATGAGDNQTVIGNSNTTHTKLCGALSKASGTFLIPHPDPAKTKTKDLQHSFVESPTEGDNLYRWSVDVKDSKSVIELPDYYRFLNKNDMVWVSPTDHFGAAYGKVTSDQRCLEVCANADGNYNVLLIGTRKDTCATSAWRGVEPDRTAGSPARNIA